jgi:predicted NAD/FAD-binding protein
VVWSAWNYRIGKDKADRATITYNMNILQHIESDSTFCVTLNDTSRIDADKIVSRHRYSHPLFTTERAAMQRQHRQLIRNQRISFCGAYWGNGFHEDGVNSALAVCGRFGVHGIDGNIARKTPVDLPTLDTGSLSSTAAIITDSSTKTAGVGRA